MPAATAAGTERTNQTERIFGLFRTMLLIRAFEEAAHQALTEGFVYGSVHQSIGQEAISVAVCGNLRRDDLIQSNHRGQARVPVVVRQAIGTRRGAAAQHSQSYEAWFVHIPGLIVVTPATPADGKGLLKSAIRCDDPVVFMEHKELWGAKGEVPADAEYLVPLGKARVARAGRDLTIVAWSRMALLAGQAAEALAKDGIDAEVIDLRTLWPWDQEAVFASVRKTGRLLVPQEAVLAGGFAGEVAATVGEALGEVLKTPIRRLGAPRMPVPYSPPLEDEYRITEKHIVAAARQMVR